MIFLNEKSSGENLFQFNGDEQGLAFEKAKELDELGIEVELIIPTVVETLAFELGSNLKESLEYISDAENELDEHD